MAGNEDDEEHQMMWLEEGEDQEGDANVGQLDEFGAGVGSLESMVAGAEASSAVSADAVRRLQAELTRTRQELVDVRKDLASKVIWVGRGQEGRRGVGVWGWWE